MFKLIVISLVSFVVGYLAASKTEEELKEKLEKFIEGYKKLSLETKKLIYNGLGSLEHFDSDEIKLNFERLLDFLKKKLQEILEIESLQAQVQASKKSLDGAKKTFDSAKQTSIKKINEIKDFVKENAK